MKMKRSQLLDLIYELDSYANHYDSYEYGLPIHKLDDMILTITQNLNLEFEEDGSTT